jgi:hypothetical protein
MGEDMEVEFRWASSTNEIVKECNTFVRKPMDRDELETETRMEG